MQCKRRYTHLFVIVLAYGFLILTARWAFFTEMWTVMESEPQVDGDHVHAYDLDFAIPVRSQRHVKESDMVARNQKTIPAIHKSITMPKVSRVLKKDHISKINKRHQLLQTIFTNFLHP